MEHFGATLASTATTVVIGAPGGAGAVYTAVINAGSWSVQSTPLKGALSTDAFGSSVSLSGNTLGATGGGQAYVYRQSGTTWNQVASFTGAAARSVAVGPDTAVVGSANAAYVFADTCTVSADCAATGYCSLGKCVSRCAHDADCAAGTFCSAAGPCVAQLAAGQSCTEAANTTCKELGCRLCATGSCADGMCCDTACIGECEACTAALTGGADGTCAPIPADQDPANECVKDPGYPDTCGAPGVCDGARHCRASAKAGTACGATTCSSGTVMGRVCNGGGQCGQASVSCAPYVCATATTAAANSACATTCMSDLDCDPATSYCLNGTCAERKVRGQLCKKSDECGESDFCVDGVCCESACEGQCQACAEKGNEGKCQPVVGAPRGSRSACAGDAAVCGGACDGADVAECKYAAATKICDGACVNGRETTGNCDGSGACIDGKPTTCVAYACGPTACLLSCTTNEDCAEGYSCTNSICVPSSASCSDDLNSSMPTGQAVVPCGAYQCDKSNGACRTQCTSVDDCASTYVCDSGGRCVPPEHAASGSRGGCGCRVGGSRDLSNSALAALYLGLITLARRRKDRASPTS